MEITRIDGPEPVYRLCGKLSFADNDAMRPLLEEMARGSGQTIILDLSQLDYVDSFGIGLFLVALDEAKKAGNRLVVRNAHGAVKRIFTLANLDTLLEMEGAAPPQPVARKIAAPTSSGGVRIGEIEADGQGGFRVALAGRFTFNDHEEFEKLLVAVAQCANAPLALDLQALEFMDSAGLSMILIAREEAERHGTRLSLYSPTGRVSQLLRLAAVDTLVDIRDPG